ncbi:hypothetical protein [Arthrobacter sp. 260]|uniref:hypothetical protein n=1 Tax=Arthrobacter sp. 260 TaxID=2735314 RepID=UPI0014923EB5|nr:hypothetical protein [Arthrobacter sp. 260]NOJ58795.1 hypothetical protein [Arthrobacter sp. 260]
MIDRQELVRRHNVVQTSVDPRSPVSVGNGEFAFTVDLTGLQSFPDEYPVGARSALPSGTLLGTQAQWGWHATPTPEEHSLLDSAVTYESPRGPVPYIDMSGSISGDAEDSVPERELWLRSNPHRLDLGRLGFAVADSSGIRPLHSTDILNPTQTLDLWTGVVTSAFALGRNPVQVATSCHPHRDQLGIQVASAALAEGLGLSLSFPYGSNAWHNGADWNSPQAHHTTVEQNDDGWRVRRSLDGSAYEVQITGAQLEIEQLGPHELWLTTKDTAMDVTVHFLSTGAGECTTRGITEPDAQKDDLGTSTAADVVLASADHWPRFWKSGGAVQLNRTRDRRAHELERRIVLSQYLTAVNCAGSMPSQETGLVCNSWRGKFHLEMHWWHSAHFALWGRPELLLRSLRWYHGILEDARGTAKWQGYDGARWPKQVGPDGRETPSTIGTFLIWQQPHPIYLAELIYRAAPSREILEEFSDIIYETAQFMVSFAHRTDKGFELGPPLVPAQESYGSTRSRTSNPTFELAYWQWALRTASAWRECLGLDPMPEWDEVATGMVAPHVADGVYSAIDVEPFTLRSDHPSMLCALGFVPQTDLINPEIMRATLSDVLADWDWDSTWGWDYPVLAMTAARLGLPETAVESLLLEAGKNTFLPNGHNRQTDSLPLYLPGNGGLLAAVALMAGGWDDGPVGPAPGFPSDWSVQVEGLVRSA